MNRIIGRILIVLALVLIVFVAVRYQNNNNERLIISDLLKKGQIQGGSLHYQVNFLSIFPVGYAIIGAERMEEYQGQKVYHLTAFAKIRQMLSVLYQVKVNLDSYVSAQDNNPVESRQRIQIKNNRIITKEISYDQKNLIMSMAGVQRSILPDTQDFLSVIFNIRHMDFTKVKEFEMNINTNQKNYLLTGKVTQKDLLVDAKMYKAAVVDMEIKRRDKKNPYHKSNIKLILLQDKENIPILIRVFASGILMSTKLTQIDYQP